MRRTVSPEKAVVLLFGVFLVWACCTAPDAYCQAPQVERAHALGINPFKLILGLVNVEVELRGTQHVGVQVFAEYQVGQWMDHPDLVARGGVHYYVSPEDQDLRGPFAGLNTGLSWSSGPAGEDEGFFLGSGAGSRLVFGDRFYVAPRLVLHYLIAQKKLLWGIEAPVGVLF